jgi:S1-C subfamily serine protease
MRAVLGLIGVLATTQAAWADWPETLERISTGIVSVTIDRVRAFDTTYYANSQATAFVVDRERGILLTNRHVVSPGPIVSEALFLNGEEVPLVPLYRDPVHDFGFFGFDPADLRHLEPAELPLAPELAEVGLDIRVVGNDAGEKLSILAGTLARLDRAAPNYGTGTFNDFNTFYFQAASSTSGGSSGSPVLQEDGRVVALNAGSNTRSASSFYLPLDRIVRALDYVRKGETPPRGSLETTFVYQRFDELRRLGLSEGTEDAVRGRADGATGMLTVDRILPGGVADGKLQVGDIVVAVGGEPIPGFVDLEAIVDDAVGDSITVTVERAGASVDVALGVADLHAITPSDFLEFGGGIVHDLSYQQARSYNVPQTGVYVADRGYVLRRAGIGYRGVIHELDDRPTPTLDAFIEVLQSLPEGHHARVRWRNLSQPERDLVAILEVDRRWFGVRRCRLGLERWPCEDLASDAGVSEPAGGSTTFDDATDGRSKKVLPSLVSLAFDIPYTIDGVRGSSYIGQGLVVDAERGLVVTDRNTVPISLGDVTITVGREVEIPAEVVLLHPFHGLALLKYDPEMLGDTPMRSAVLDTTAVEEGDKLFFVGRNSSDKAISKAVRADERDIVQLPVPSRPRFRESNLETVDLREWPDANGVVTDGGGKVLALWGTYSYQDGTDASEAETGYPSWVIEELLDAWDGDRTFRAIEAELVPLPLLDARHYGLDDDWFETLAEADPRRFVFQVSRLTAGAPAADVLEEGDLLLALGGEPISTMRQVAEAGRGTVVTATLLRDGKELTVDVPTRAVSGRGIERVLVWAGAFLQETPLAASQLRAMPMDGVYVDLRFRGSPSMRSGLPRNSRIVEVDGAPTPDLDAFLRAVAGKEDRASLRLEVVDMQGRSRVVTLKLDLHAFPTRELLWGDDGWERRELTSL